MPFNFIIDSLGTSIVLFLRNTPDTHRYIFPNRWLNMYTTHRNSIRMPNFIKKYYCGSQRKRKRSQLNASN